MSCSYCVEKNTLLKQLIADVQPGRAVCAVFVVDTNRPHTSAPLVPHPQRYNLIKNQFQCKCCGASGRLEIAFALFSQMRLFIACAGLCARALLRRAGCVRGGVGGVGGAFPKSHVGNVCQ